MSESEEQQIIKAIDESDLEIAQWYKQNLHVKSREIPNIMEGKGYSNNAWGSTLEETFEEKMEQRRECVRALPFHDIILELFAGKGNLTEKVYLGAAKKHILVDKESYIYNVEEKLKGKADYEIYQQDNINWIIRVLPSKLEELEQHLTLIDFDDFGMPGETIQRFFTVFKIRHPLVVCLTDGGYYRLMWNKQDMTALMQKNFGLGSEYVYSKTNHIAIDDAMMNKIAEAQNCTIERISVAYNPKTQGAVYAGYLLTPKVT